jgi:hypothetical protein
VIGAELPLLLEFEGDEDIAGGRPEDQAAVASDGPEEVASVDERDTSPRRQFTVRHRLVRLVRRSQRRLIQLGVRPMMIVPMIVTVVMPV